MNSSKLPVGPPVDKPARYPITKAIDEGHFSKVVKDVGTVCRADAEPWPCARLVEARAEQAIQVRDEMAADLKRRRQRELATRHLTR